MDSVQSLNQFFGKLNDEFVTIANNSKTNNQTLTQLYASEQKEEQGRKQAAVRAKTRRQRATRKKKRNKLDTAQVLKSAMEKVFGNGTDKKDGEGVLSAMLKKAGIVAIIGGGALFGLKAVVGGAVSDAISNINDGIGDFLKKITGQMDSESAQIQAEIESGVSQIDDSVAEIAATADDITAAANKVDPRATQPPADSEVVAPTPTATTQPETANEVVESEKTRVEETRVVTNNTTINEEEEESGGIMGFINSLFGGGNKKPPASAMRQAGEDDVTIGGTMETKGKTIARRLMSDLNISAAAASGIVGNLMLESGLQPDNVENGKGFADGPINNIPVGTQRVGYGYGQWTNDRLEKFRGWLTDRGKADRPATDEDNYQYLLHELRGDEPIRNHWKSGTSIPENDPVAAANWFMMNWERPGKPHADRRQAYAKQIHGKLERRQLGGVVGSSAFSQTNGVATLQSGGAVSSVGTAAIVKSPAQSKGSASAPKSPAQSVGAAVAPKSPKQSVGEAKLQRGGIVPGSGTGDKVPVSLPQGSFVLNKKATTTLHKLQVGGVASIGGKTVNAIEERFFAANETYSETVKKKKQRPVVVVDVPAPAPSSAAPAPMSKRTPDLSGGGLNMSEIRSKMHRVNAGAAF